MPVPKQNRLIINELSSRQVSVCGTSFDADMSGALFWPSQNAVVVADLKLASLGAAGTGAGAVGHDSGGAETLTRLAAVVDHYNASTVIALGFGHAGLEAAGENDSGIDIVIDDEDRKTLSIMQDHCRWIWVGIGNNDVLGGSVRETFEADGITLRHRPQPGLATHEIAGALRPAAKISRHGHEIFRPCIVSDGLRLVLPAFSTYAGGRNIMGEAFEPMFGTRGRNVLMLGHDGLYPIAPRLLVGD